ncbi:MAG: cytochrome C oxidase subunit IV family protein [Actinomycetota bacterium]
MEARQADVPSEHNPAAPAHAMEHAHPGPLQYVKVAVVLAVVTAVEVMIYYIPAVRPYIAPLLIVLSAIKFGMVALWFMHLKFDSRLFRRLFITGIILALAVFAIVLLTFGLLLR